jgi:hypothetical protein
MKKIIRLTENDLHNIVRKVVNEARKKKEQPIYPYHMQSMMGIKHPTDSVKGKFLRYSPEDSGFSSSGYGNPNDEYDKEQMISLIDTAMHSLAEARKYAHSMNNQPLYNLFNAILGELHSTIKKERGEEEYLVDF